MLYVWRWCRRRFYLFENAEVISCTSLKEKIPERKLRYTTNYNGKSLHSFWQSLEWYYDQLRVFLTSFTFSRDNEYVWRMFGGHGEGFSIRFCKDFFNSAFNNDTSSSNHKPEEIVVVTKICYEDAKEDGILLEF